MSAWAWRAAGSLLLAAILSAAAAQGPPTPAEMLTDADAFLQRRQLDEARALYLRAEALCHRALDITCETHAQRSLGYVELYAGDTGMAAQAFGRGLERAVEVEDLVGEAKAVLGLAELAMAQLGPYRAGLLYQRALEEFRAAGDRMGEAAALRGLSAAAALAKQTEPSGTR